MNWNVQSVASEAMKDKTDGAWTWNLFGPNSGNKYEVPSDGIVQIRFDTIIDLDLVKKAGFFQCASKGVTVKGPCGSSDVSSSSSGASYCVNVTLNSALVEGEECVLQVSTSEYYHPLSGPYRGSSGSTPTLVGKLPFRFDFLRSDNWQMQNVGYRGLRLWIRHGLPVNTDLTSVISVSPQPEAFTVTVPEKYMVLLTGKFEPRTQYTVTVSADSSITDGLDQPLGASSGQFSMKAPESNILHYLPSSSMQFHPDDALTEFPVVGIAGDRSVQVRACDVTATNLDSVLFAVFRGSRNGGWFCDSPDAQTTTLDSDGHVKHPLTFPASGMLFLDLQQSYNSCPGCQSNTQRLISSSDLHAVVAVSSATPQSPVGAVDVMVSRLTDKVGLAGATVSLWSVSSYNTDKANKVGDVATVDGHARYEGACQQCIAVVSDAAGAMAVLSDAFYVSERGSSSDVELRAQVVFDRSIYAPGERGTASGWFVQKNCATALSCTPTAAALQALALTMRFNRGGWGVASQDPPPIALDVDSSSGVFTAEFEVPIDAEYGAQPSFQISHTDGRKASVTTASAAFVIADPRLPTAVLTLTAPEYADPSVGSVAFECKVETFTGIPLSNVAVSFRAELTGKDACGSMVGVEGAADVRDTVTTNADGIAVLSLNVATAAWELEDGQAIRVSASAIGPTGSPLGGSGETMLFATLVELSALELSVSDPLPDVTFDVATSLNLRVSEGEATVTEAGVRLVEATSCADVATFADVGSALCDVAANGLDVTCEGVSFASDAATIALVVVAATSNGNGMVQACTAIGMPLVRDWRRSMAVSVELAGASADVSFRNPFGARPAVGWIVWQGGHSGLIDLTVSGNRETHSIAIANNLAYGSALNVQVHTWLPVGDTAVDLSADLTQATMSKLLGSWGLLTYSGSASVAMTAPVDNLMAAVSLRIPELAAPEATVPLEIDAGAAAANGEAIVYVVDQSIFELQPSALPDTAGFFGQTESVAISIASSSAPLSGQAVADAADTLAGLALRDPFVRVAWSSKWLDGDYAQIVQGSEYQTAITYGSFPWTVNYPAYLQDDYLYYWAFRTGCPYSGRGGGGGDYYMEMDDALYMSDAMPESGAAAPSAGADQGGGAEKSADGGGGSGESASGAGVTLREGVETVRTALVRVVTLDADGKATLDIAMPADRKKWSVRVHVASAQTLKFGSAETFVTVRSDMYLTALVPRALRLTDAPRIGALVQSVQPSSTAEAIVAVESYDTAVYELEGSSTTTVATTSSSVAALFEFKVIGTPPQGALSQVVLSLAVGGAVIDRMALSLAVDLHARPLLIGTSRAVSAPESGSGAWQEVVALPARVEAESAITLHAAVSQYDRIKAHCFKSAVDPISLQISADPPVTPSADDLIAAAYCLSVLKTADMPVCAGTCRTSLFNKYLRSTADVLAELLSAYTDASTGKLHWTARSERWAQQSWVDVRLSAVALLMQRLTSANADAQMKRVESWLQTAVAHIGAMHARWPDSDLSWDAAHLWLAVSSSPSSSMASVMRSLPAKYAFSALKDSLAASDRSAISLRLLLNAAEGAHDPSLATAVLNALRLSSDATAYIAWPGGAGAMDEPWQQFGLLALCQQPDFARDERVWRVAVYVGQGGGARWNPWQSRYDTLSLLATGMALTKLDEQTDNSDPQVDVTVTLNDTPLWEVALPVSDDQRSASEEVSAAVANPSGNAVLSWAVSGTGTVFTYLSAYLIPAEPWPTPVSRGFQVQKLIQLLDTATGRCSGDMITSATRGQLVCVSLLVTSADDVRNVRIEDWSPSGLEPMDSNVDGIAEALAAMATEEAGDGALGAFCPRWWGWCYSSETREVKAASVEWTVRGFFAGSREFKYIALANVPGKYVLPSSVAEDIDNPTYTGMSGSAYFAVQGDASTGGAVVAVADMETPALARRKLLIDAAGPRCAAVESSEQGGWCDEATGKWMCGQVECGTSALPEGCAEVDGQIRCDDVVTDDNNNNDVVTDDVVTDDVVTDDDDNNNDNDTATATTNTNEDDADAAEIVSEIEDGSGGDAATNTTQSEAASDGDPEDADADAEDDDVAEDEDEDEDEDDGAGETGGEESGAESTATPELTLAACSSGSGQAARECIAGVASEADGAVGCGASAEAKALLAHCVAAQGCCSDWAALVQQTAEASEVDPSECAMGACSELAFRVAMKLKLPYTASEFTQQKQTQFIQAVADAAQVAVQLVRIASFSEVRRRLGGRALLAASLEVDVEILAASKAAADALAGSEKLKVESLNDKLEPQLGVRSEMLAAPEAAPIAPTSIDPTPSQEGSAPSRSAGARVSLSAFAVLATVAWLAVGAW